MVQVLHLMSTGADLQSSRTSAQIRRSGDEGVAVTLRRIGPGAAYRNAAHAALSLRFGRGVPFDLIHAFDGPSLLAACAAPSPLVFSPSEAPATLPPWWPGAMVYRKGIAIATTAAMRRRLIRGGIPGPRCDVISPPIDPDALVENRDEALRGGLGILPEHRVVLAPGESTRAAGHLLALHAVSILHVLDPRVRLLIWGRGQQLTRLHNLARLLRQERVLIAAEPTLGRTIEFEQLIGLADLAIVASPQAPAMPIAMCMAGGLPVISARSAATDELLEDCSGASLATGFAPRLLAQRLLWALENADQAGECGRRGRLQAIRQFDPRLTVGRFTTLYRRVAGVSAKESPTAPSRQPVLSK